MTQRHITEDGNLGHIPQHGHLGLTLVSNYSVTLISKYLTEPHIPEHGHFGHIPEHVHLLEYDAGFQLPYEANSEVH